MKRVIVTGANGFVGSAVCKELLNQHYEVVAVVRNKNSDITRISGLPITEIVYCEMSEYKKLPSLIKTQDIDTVYHFAWEGSAGSDRGNYEIQCSNIKNSCELIRSCSSLNVSRFVFASSIMEYEIQKCMQNDDNTSINSLYCSAKVATNYMIRSIANNFGVDYIRGVISNIYGPGEISPRLVNTTIRKLLNGEHCSFSPGEQLYDFIYITDAGKAFVSIGEKGVNNKTYYIGSLEPRPLKEFLYDIRNVVDVNAQLGLGDFPFNGVSLQYNEFNIDEVRLDTGFIPEVTFKQGIKNTMEWLKDMMK